MISKFEGTLLSILNSGIKLKCCVVYREHHGRREINPDGFKFKANDGFLI